MVDTITIVVCAECRAFWRLDAGAPQCTEGTHQHVHHTLHRHRSPVVLPDGTGLTAVSFDDADPYSRDVAPDYGVYLDARWQPPWPHRHLDWPDFGLPDDADGLLAALQAVLDRARAGARVEIGCLGGHGRTGTALACLAVLCGHPAGQAVDWVRANYCAKAVETDAQARFVAALPVRGTPREA